MGKTGNSEGLDPGYSAMLGSVSDVIESARRSIARSVNSTMTAAYWLVGRSIVEYEQGGKKRAKYGSHVINRLSADLTATHGRGFGAVNLSLMKKFYLIWSPEKILHTPSEESPSRASSPTREAILQTPSEKSGPASPASELERLGALFPLPWSAYVRLLAVKNEEARAFYETEALRSGWSVRQLARQIDSQFYERTALSKNKAAMLTKSRRAPPGDVPLPEEQIKDPYVLEFLDLKDEYSESDLEEALIHHLEGFLLELGDDFCFVGRQKRLRVGYAWYRMDLVFFHRRLRCLLIIDLKTGPFTHADAGQMNLYLNYARENWVRDGENPPVGLVLCSHKDRAVAHYALEGLANKVMAAEYRTVLPDEKALVAEIEKTRDRLDSRSALALPGVTSKAAPERANKKTKKKGETGSRKKQ